MPIDRGGHGTTSSRAPRRDAIRNDKLVLEAALAVFSESGPQAGMEEIAERAGVGVGTIYRRFPSKDALLDALAAQIAGEMETAITEAIADNDPGRGLTEFLEFAGEFNVTKRRLSPVLAERVGDQGVTAAMADKVSTLTRRAIECGTLAPDVSPEDILSLIKAMRGVVADSTAGDETWRRFLHIHLAGLRSTR